MARGRLEEPLRLSGIGLDRLEQWYGVHTYTIDAEAVRSKVLEAVGRSDEALEVARRVVKDSIAAFCPDMHPMARRLADAQLTHLEGGAAGRGADRLAPVKPTRARRPRERRSAPQDRVFSRGDRANGPQRPGPHARRL